MRFHRVEIQKWFHEHHNRHDKIWSIYRAQKHDLGKSHQKVGSWFQEIPWNRGNLGWWNVISFGQIDDLLMSYWWFLDDFLCDFWMSYWWFIDVFLWFLDDSWMIVFHLHQPCPWTPWTENASRAQPPPQVLVRRWESIETLYVELGDWYMSYDY